MWLRVGVTGGKVYVNDDSEVGQAYSGPEGTKETKEKEAYVS